MSFVSFSFLALYSVALGLRLLAPSGSRVYVLGLLVLSWTFYAWHVPQLLLLIVASTAVDYVAARALGGLDPTSTRRRHAVLVVSLVTNLGLLGTFKYAGFLVRASRDLATAFGLAGWDPLVPELVLPIGISFYTFQSMSYTIDVYRGRLDADRSFLRVACYISFFPQLVAGPIVRARGFLYQLGRRRRLRARVFGEGSYLILRGFFLKVAVADNLGRIVDEIWPLAASGEASSAVSLSVLVFFAGQLFCDFAGYSDIARGLAYHLGFRLPVNFDAPYLARTFSEFWRRWHITLSTWMRDYLYIPLGGNRLGAARAVANLFAVMLISGLWHGANWNFVAWGAVHGLAAALERLLGLARGPRSGLATAAWYVVVQAVWILSMALFRADGIGEGWRLLQGTVGSNISTAMTDGATRYSLVLGWCFMAPVAALHLRRLAAERFRLDRVWLSERAVYAGVMSAAALTLYTPAQGFIYFQF